MGSWDPGSQEGQLGPPDLGLQLPPGCVKLYTLGPFQKPLCSFGKYPSLWNSLNTAVQGDHPWHCLQPTCSVQFRQGETAEKPVSPRVQVSVAQSVGVVGGARAPTGDSNASRGPHFEDHIN